MHAVIIDELEEYLAGDQRPAVSRRFQAHLENCLECSRELRSMREVTKLVASLKPAGVVEPSPSFVARVMQDSAAQPAARPLGPFWSFLGDFAFGRRVVFASLLTLAALGTILVSRETAYAPAPTTPDAVMADDWSSPTPDRMLVKLTSYEP